MSANMATDKPRGTAYRIQLFIAERPELASIPEQLKQLLERAQAQLDGALAVVSGRTVADLDRLTDEGIGTAPADQAVDAMVADQHGQQVEHPDTWLRYGSPWEFPRSEHTYPVRFYGVLSSHTDSKGSTHDYWEDSEEVLAMAYDIPIPGYGTHNVNNLRLWSARASQDFDLRYFNEGDYIGAVESKSENLPTPFSSSVPQGLFVVTVLPYRRVKTW